MMFGTPKTPKVKAFSRFFSKKKLHNVYHLKISDKKNAGIDGIDCAGFESKEDFYFDAIKKKANKGSYKFTPYAEIHISKGRGKAPRLLGLPTLRDQLTLSCLKDFLHANFEESINKRLPNSYIFDLNKVISELAASEGDIHFIKTDITGFYDNIDREKLMNIIRRKINDPKALKLIYSAITNPIVPRNSKKKQRYHYYTSKGVPQGLAISNILADIYLCDFDETSKKMGRKYIRYVDDIILICPHKSVAETLKKLRYEMLKLGLELNDNKTESGTIGGNSFDFLGYKFVEESKHRESLISVRESSIERLISSLSGILVHANHNYSIDKEANRIVLIEDLNEKITGAYSEHKRYGWLFYFSQINDLHLLHRLDNIVEKLCRRCEIFKKEKSDKIKSFLRTFREIHEMRMKNTTSSDYILNYDNFTLGMKIKFLERRELLPVGKIVDEEKIHIVDGERVYSEDVINSIFEPLIRRRMSRLEMDVKGLS